MMDIDEIEFKDPPEFIKYVCGRLNMTKEEFRDEFHEACVNGHFDSPVFSTVRKLFRFHCFCSSRFRTKNKMLCTTKLFEYLISGNLGFDNLRRKLKEYDYSARCSLVWTTNYFAYRCRTCGMSPSMSLCSSCFTAGNHEGHDFNKFKSHAGGACDCGDATVMKESGFCRFHGLDKVHNRPVPPDDLVAPLRCLLPSFLSALLYWLWEHGRDSDGLNFNEDDTPAISILHALHASGWVTQKMIADVMIDKAVYEKLIYETESRRACGDYQLSVSSNPEFEFPPIISNQNLVHQTLLDAFIFSTIKLRFPESLVTFLIGLLAVEEFKEEFIQSYLNHYTRIASTVLLSARARISPEWSLQMNNRIVHISVQLFSGEELALRVIKQRNLHHLLVHCLLNMLTCCRTRLDDRSNMVLSCDGILIQNNVFWPFVSDLSNLVSHKSIVDILVEDADFLSAWTKLIRYMQFMNCFTMKEGNHIEYETMTFYHAFTMEVEISSATMWNFWKHCRLPSERTHCLLYTKACLSTLADLLNGLGRLISPTVPETRPTRSALSLHLPLMRHVSCFLHLSTMQHGVNIRQLLVDYLLPKPRLLRRFMEHLVNILLGCHEVLIGYWIRNGQSVRQSVSHYMQSQFCYSFIDLDIFALQVCTTLLPPAYFLNALVDQTKLLRGICFHNELLSLVSEPEVKNLDRKPIALQAWLTNLCWILDLRNNLGLTEEELLQKELVSVLAPEPRKRSDLSILIPERCGIINPSNNLDSVLRKVATYSAPSCDETSGSLISGHYYLRPSLWHTDFDPIFHLLRVTSRRESSLAMEKYREHCRQRHGVTNMSSLWPPFHKPKQLPPDFRGLDHVLHSRHLHYIIFIQLSLFVYGDPLVTEESLAMIIHLIDRALDTPCRLPGNNRKTCTKIYMENQASKSGESNLPTLSLNNVNDYETGTKHLIEQKQTEEINEIQQQQQPLKQKEDLITEKSQNAFVDDFIMDWEKGRFEDVLEDTDSDRLDQIDYDDDDDDDEYGDDDVVDDDDDNNSNETVAGVGSSDDRDLNELTIDSQRINNKQLRTKTRNYRSSHIWRRQPWSSLCPLPSTPSFSSSSNTTTTNLPPTNNRQKKFWDTSLINCPYQSRTGIQDNLNCWLMISKHNIPQVSCAQVMLASLPLNQGSDLNCTLSTVPVLLNNEIQNDSKNIMLDSIISLLIKAHARLHWSRIVGGADAIPKISFGGSLFTDPNLTAQQSGITDTSMSVTTTMPSVNVDDNNPITLGQDQVDGSWQDFLNVFPKHNTVVSNATTTTNNNCLTPRCMAVLMPNERHECSNLNNSSSPTASSSFASNNVNLNTSIIANLPPELRYFASSKPTYFLPEERNESTYRRESINATKSYNFTSSLANNDDNSLTTTTTNDVCHFTNFGDGAYWIERLLDKIASLSENNKSAIKMYLARARSPYKQVIHLHTLQPMDVISSSSSSSNVVQQFQQKQQLTVSHNSNAMNTSKEGIDLNNETDVIFNISFSSTNDGNNSSMNQNSSCLLTTSAVGTRDERKRAAQERRKRLIEQMTSKQKAFASTHLKDIESLNQQTVDRKEQLDNSEPLYECVICQISGRPSVDDMVLLDMICESNLMLQLRETAVIPTLYGRDLSHSSGYPPVLSETDDLSWLSPERPPVSGSLFQNYQLSNSTNPDNPSTVSGSSQAPAGIVGLPIHPITTNSSIELHTERSSSPKPETLSGNKQSKHHSCYTEHRQWWSNAMPSLISKALPLLHSGILLQTCGHVVHRECFQRYRTHGGNRSAATRHRSWIVCPLCRRDIHHLLPLVPLPKSGTFGNKQQLFPSVEYGQQNIAMLLSRLNSLSDTGSTFWSDLNGSEDELNVQRRILMSQLIGSNYEATILLRCQLECELSVLMSYPSQYSMVSRRCYWREFICYLRQIYKKSSDIKNLIQCLMIDEVIRSDIDNDNTFPVFALLQDPADILLGLLPHIWPHEGIFHTVLASTFCLAYIRALISVTFNRSTSSTCFNLVKQINRTRCLLGKISGVLRKHLEILLNYLSELNTSFTPSTSDDDHHLHDTQRDQQFHSTESLEDTCPSSNKMERIFKVLYLASKLPDENFFNQSSLSSSSSTAASSSSLSSITATTPPSLPVEYDQNQIELHIILRILPFLRIASLCWTRWHPDNVGTVKPLGLPFVGLLMKSTQKTNSHNQLSTKEFVSITPEQQLIEFSDLCRILSLDCGDSTVINVAQVGELAGRLCGLCSPNNNNAIECLIGRWIGQIKKVSSVHLTASSPTLLLSSSSPVCDVSSHINVNDVNQLSNIDHRNILTEVENVSSVSRGTSYFILHIADYLRSLVEIGRQLYSPRLIRTPSSFDVLFNALHLVNCSSNQHRFQDNILCLICGRLLCSLCSNLATVVVEHTYMCGGFSGVVLEVNTSIVYVSLGSNICDWGSVYLDEYGEEDLELKRGKPLFLNAERFALLENQWITHSFRHVLKNWRSV